MLVDIVMFRASWFVVVIGVLQFIYALALYRKPSNTKLFVVTLLLFSLGYLGVIFYRDLPVFISGSMWLQSPTLPNRFPFCLNIALVMCPFFWGGILYRQYEDRIRSLSIKSTLILVFIYFLAIWIDRLYLGSEITVVMNEYNNLILVFVYGLVGIAMIIGISKKIKKIPPINYIGKNSLLFYFFNGLLLQATCKITILANIYNNGGYWGIIVVAFVACTLAFPISMIINRYFPFLIGKKGVYKKCLTVNAHKHEDS